jgi:hypothetical protein
MESSCGRCKAESGADFISTRSDRQLFFIKKDGTNIEIFIFEL